MSFSIIGPFNFYSSREQTNHSNSLNRIWNIFRQIFNSEEENNQYIIQETGSQTQSQQTQSQQTQSQQTQSQQTQFQQADSQTQSQQTQFQQADSQTQSQQTDSQVQTSAINRQTTQLDTLDNIIFYVDDEIGQNNGLSITEINNNSTIETNFDSNVNETICSICRQPIVNICRKLNNCSHSFHVACIDEWLVTNNTCPICRAVIPTERVVRNQPLQFRYYYNTR